MRAFIAIKPPVDICKHYFGHINKYAGSFSGKIVRYDQMHITLFFFEDITDRQKDMVADALKDFSGYGSFEIKLEKYSLFYRNKMPSVCFVKCVSEELFILRKKLEKQLDFVEFDRKPFKAHLTLARIKKVSDDDNFNRFLSESAVKYFSVYEILFIKSTLKSNGPVYETIFKINLKR